MAILVSVIGPFVLNHIGRRITYLVLMSLRGIFILIAVFVPQGKERVTGKQKIKKERKKRKEKRKRQRKRKKKKEKEKKVLPPPQDLSFLIYYTSEHSSNNFW